MRTRRILLTALFASALSGCAGVVSTHLVGESPVVLVAEEWQGTWSDAEDFLEIRAVDAQAGLLEAAWIESGGDGFELERVKVSVRQTGEALFGNVVERPDAKEPVATSEGGPNDEAPTYAFFRLKHDGDTVIIWWPRVEAFRELVEAGVLPGTVTENDEVVLGALSDEQLRLLSSDESAELYEWQEPEILTRRGN